MQAHHLADLAALVAVNSPAFIAADREPLASAMTAYWQASRCRFDRWCRVVRQLTMQTSHRESSPESLAVLEEIFVSVILSRTIAAVAVAHDNRHGAMECGPVARNILSGHLDARRRALALVATPANRGHGRAQALLALARQCDRWSDLVLSYLAPQIEVAEFAASRIRVHDFAADAQHQLWTTASSYTAVTMIVLGMRTSFAPIVRGPTPNSDLNRDIGQAILACLPAESFDSLGLLRSTWLGRLQQTSSDSPTNVAKMWAAPPTSSLSRHTPRWSK